jgi:hypothetical protein
MSLYPTDVIRTGADKEKARVKRQTSPAALAACARGEELGRQLAHEATETTLPKIVAAYNDAVNIYRKAAGLPRLQFVR